MEGLMLYEGWLQRREGCLGWVGGWAWCYTKTCTM